MATIKDIADEVGISKAAVSRILNNKGSFSAETTEKVWRVAKRLNYLPSGGQHADDADDIKVLAAIFPQEGLLLNESPYYSIMISLLEKAAYDYGYSLMLCGALYNWEDEEKIFRSLRQRNVRGVILGSFSHDAAIFHNQRIPVVTIGTKASDQIPCIRSDNYASGQAAARHLLGKGCRRPLYITGYWRGLEYDERYRGFADELARHEVTPKAYHLGMNATRLQDIEGIITRMALDNPDADALFAESYSLSLECLRTYIGLGWRIPQDLKMVGYGNAFLTAYSNPRITLVKEDSWQIARRAVSLLVDLIENGPSAEASARDILVPISLEAHQTT